MIAWGVQAEYFSRIFFWGDDYLPLTVSLLCEEKKNEMNEVVVQSGHDDNVDG